MEQSLRCWAACKTDCGHLRLWLGCPPMVQIPQPVAKLRLRKHGDYQRVYRASRKQFSNQMAYFFALRPQLGADGKPLRDTEPASPRIGLTVPKALGKAVDRNRIKRRMREAVRAELAAAGLDVPVDVILHPRRTAITLPMPELRREVEQVFRAVRKMAKRNGGSS